MRANKTDKRVIWFDDGKRPNVADALEKEKDIIVHRRAFAGPQADNWGAMSASHAYCITSARHEVPDEYKCNAALIARCPDLLAVSTTGAGYDTVDVAACTAAGALFHFHALRIHKKIFSYLILVLLVGVEVALVVSTAQI